MFTNSNILKSHFNIVKKYLLRMIMFQEGNCNPIKKWRWNNKRFSTVSTFRSWVYLFKGTIIGSIKHCYEKIRLQNRWWFRDQQDGIYHWQHCWIYRICEQVVFPWYPRALHRLTTGCHRVRNTHCFLCNCSYCFCHDRYQHVVRSLNRIPGGRKWINTILSHINNQLFSLLLSIKN